jgi:hypothetical protein
MLEFSNLGLRDFLIYWGDQRPLPAATGRPPERRLPQVTTPPMPAYLSPPHYFTKVQWRVVRSKSAAAVQRKWACV